METVCVFVPMKRENDIMSVDAMMDERFGKVGTPEREIRKLFMQFYAYIFNSEEIRL